MEQKYIIITKLKDGSEVEGQTDYIWGYENALNDLNKQFITICENIFNKNEIVSILITENPLYKKTEENNE